MARSIQYSIILRDARGFKTRNRRPVTWGHARFFDLFYGKRRLVNTEEFPKGFRVNEKKALLNLIVSEIEHKKEKVAKKRKAQLKKCEREEKARQRALKLKREERRLEKKRVDVFLAERLDHKNKRKERSKVRQSKVKGPVTIIPFIPVSDEYTKEIILKTVDSERHGLMKLRIMDFTLAEYLEADEGNLSFVLGEAANIFKPHLDKFWNETQKTRRGYIFRIKYLSPFSKKLKIHQGLGSERFFATRKETYVSFIADTFKKFTRKTKQNKYLERTMSGTIFITGFTMEVIESAKGNLRK
jgi:hypothetical protein